jgi:hypothetical protein
MAVSEPVREIQPNNVSMQEVEKNSALHRAVRILDHVGDTHGKLSIEADIEN